MLNPPGHLLEHGSSFHKDILHNVLRDQGKAYQPVVLLLTLLKTDTTFPVTGDLSVVTTSPRWDGAASPILFHRLARVQFAGGVQCNTLPWAPPLTPNHHITRADLANNDWGKETLHTSAFSCVLHHRVACLIQQQTHIFFCLHLLTTYLRKSFLLPYNPLEFQLQLNFPNVPSACLYPSWVSHTSSHLLHTVLFPCLSSVRTSPLSSLAKLVTCRACLVSCTSGCTAVAIWGGCPGRSAKLTWSYSPFRASSHGILRFGSLERFKSVVLNSDVFILLLASLGILSSYISESLQPRPHPSLNQLFVSSRSRKATLLGAGWANYFTISS